MPTVAIDQISIGRNRRPLKDEKVAELMESIQANGLLNPITLDQKLNLIAGLHRLTACKLLGFDKIECKIISYEDSDRARLAEIDENLIRSELDALERAELWLERDRILEQLGLRAKPGDNQYTHQGGEMISPPPKTTLELAKEAGYTERTFQQGKQIAKSIVPEVKQAIQGTPIAKSPTALLKVARAGSKEAAVAIQAEKASQEAKARQEQQEAQRQAKLAQEARARQKELQLIALQNALAEKEAKFALKKAHTGTPPEDEGAASVNQPRVQVGDEWILDRHLMYCGDTSSEQFIEYLPGNAALAIATLSSTWNHDYLIDQARVVAVLRQEGYIHDLCSRHQMPFRSELILGDMYLAIFSHQLIPKLEKPIGIEGVEGIVAYLVSLYTKPSNFVIAPFLGQGEVLMACEKMGRICFAGDENPELVQRAIARWQKWTQKPAQKAV
jgi:ParB family transcriptional regulator, chromosome partitioning protein